MDLRGPSEQVATNDQIFSDLVIFRLRPQNWFLTPPANPVKFFWLEMPSNYVPLIVLQVSTSNRTYRGSLRPLKGQKWPKYHFFGHFWVCFVQFRNFSHIPIEMREKCRVRKSFSSFRSPDRFRRPGKFHLPVHHYRLTETPLSSLSPVFSSIFWAIFGQKPLRVHQWDMLESVSGVLDPYRGHFSPKNWTGLAGGGQKRSNRSESDFWPIPWKIQ